MVVFPNLALPTCLSLTQEGPKQRAVSMSPPLKVLIGARD